MKIATVDGNASIADHCREKDIVLVTDDCGWWTCFIGAHGAIETCDIAFSTLEKSVNTARAAAEFASE